MTRETEKHPDLRVSKKLLPPSGWRSVRRRLSWPESQGHQQKHQHKVAVYAQWERATGSREGVTDILQFLPFDLWSKSQDR